MIPKQQQLPSECSICRDKIGLYQPFYTISIHPHFVKGHRDFSKQSVFCPNCFQAYENFLIEREVQENHKRNYKEMKGEI